MSNDLSHALWPMQWVPPRGVHALCTTRQGGVSLAPFDTLNLGDHVGDDPAAVAKNRTRLLELLDPIQPVFLKQVHGTHVVSLTSSTLDGTQADASLTMLPNLACTIMVADCLPLLLTDVAGRVVAAAHAGWRGMASGVLEQTVRQMCHAAEVMPANIQVWLGPCIGPSAFEVGDDVRQAFTKDDSATQQFFEPHPQSPSKWMANLSALARHRLQAIGVEDVQGNDGSIAWCTVSQKAYFFSHRRDRVSGRFAVCIWRDG